MFMNPKGERAEAGSIQWRSTSDRAVSRPRPARDSLPLARRGSEDTELTPGPVAIKIHLRQSDRRPVHVFGVNSPKLLNSGFFPFTTQPQRTICNDTKIYKNIF